MPLNFRPVKLGARMISGVADFLDPLVHEETFASALPPIHKLSS